MLWVPVRLESDRSRLARPELSVRCRSSETVWVEILPRVLAAAYTWISTSQPTNLAQLTAFGRCNIPTLKSQSKSLQSSPTLPNRYVLSSHRQGSKATAVTHESCPKHRAIIWRSASDQIVTRSSCPPVRTYFPSGDQQTHVKPP